MADDAAVLLVGAGHESRHIHQGDQRDVERIAKAHETSGFDRGVVVQDPGQHSRLVGHQADGLAAEATETADDVAGKLSGWTSMKSAPSRML